MAPKKSPPVHFFHQKLSSFIYPRAGKLKPFKVTPAGGFPTSPPCKPRVFPNGPVPDPFFYRAPTQIHVNWDHRKWVQALFQLPNNLIRPRPDFFNRNNHLANVSFGWLEGMAEYLSLGRYDGHTAMWMRDARFAQ